MKHVILVVILAAALVVSGPGMGACAPDPAKEARDHIRQGDYDMALEKFNQAVQADSRNYVHYINRAYVLYHQGNYFQALADYNRALERNPRSRIALNGRGLIYEKIGDRPRALKDLDRAISLGAGYATPYYNRGNIHVRQGDLPGAVKDFSQGLELAGKDPYGYFSRGTAYLVLDKKNEAIQDFDAALRLKSGFAMAHNNRGLAYYHKGEYEKAIQDFDQALKIDPDLKSAYLRRGLARLQKAGCEQASGDISRGIDIGLVFYPDLAETAGPAVASPAPQKRVRKPRVNTAYQKIDAVCDGGAAYYQRGVRYYASGKYDLALMDLNNAIWQNPGFGQAYRSRAMVYQKLGDPVQARADLDRADQLGDTNDFDPDCCNARRYHMVPCVTESSMPHSISKDGQAVRNAVIPLPPQQHEAAPAHGRKTYGSGYVRMVPDSGGGEKGSYQTKFYKGAPAESN